MSTKVKQRIAVLGAGPMGLATAYQLALDGHHPILYEADDRIGGMTASFDFGGLNIERYYHFHCTSDLDFLEMLNELGIADKLHWVPTKMGFWYQNRLQPWGNPIALLKFKGLGLVAKFRYGLHAFISTKRKNWQKLDSIDAISWIKHWVGKQAYEVLWDNLFQYKFHNYANNISAAWIWSRIRRIGNSRFNLFQEKLGYLEGGSETLLNAMDKAIKSLGGEIHLNSRIDRIEIDNNIVRGIRVNNQYIQFDKVISTIPIPYIPKIAPNLPAQTLKQYQDICNIAVVCVVAKIKKKMSDNFWVNTNDPEMDIPGIIEYSNLMPLDQHIVYVPFYMPWDHPKFAASNEVFIEKTKNYIRKINQALSDDDFIDMHASRYRYAQPICQPNFRVSLPNVKTPILGLWIADTCFYYPDDRGISESIKFGRNIGQNINR
jgi:protoporphyrinogen oxidase